MKWLAFWLFALPCVAQSQDHPFALADQVGAVFQAEGEDGVFRFLESNIRRARASGQLTPEWAVLFMMLADSARNTRANAAYALRLADEGLELARSGTIDDRDMAVLLEVSRAYILADLGRFEEAVTAAVMALPAFRAQFGDADADDLQSYALDWSKGQLSAFNTSALTVAQGVLDQAEGALNKGEYGSALTLAARAFLPPDDVGLDPAQLAASNTRAGFVSGQALYLLNRYEAAKAALTGAADLAAPGWRQGEGVGGGPALADLFFWLGRACVAVDDRDLARTALALADRLTTDPRARNSLLFARVGLMEALGDGAGAIAALDAASLRKGIPDQAALAGFYAALLRARAARDLQTLQSAGVLAAAQAALGAAAPGNAIAPDFIRTQAAPWLLAAGDAENALAFARAALSGTLAAIAESRDTDTGTLAARKATREVVDTLLASAHTLDAQSPIAFCPDLEGAGCVIFAP